MKRPINFVIILIFILTSRWSIFSQVHTTYLWHLQQPIYWPEVSISNPNHYQTVKESHDIKISGGNNYGTGTSHPTNNLQEIFSLDDRKNVYQHGARNSINQLTGYPDAGAQVNYSGVLIENVNSLANAGQWGYYSGWQNNYVEARSWTTSDGFPRMDIVGFTFHHTLSPLITERAFRKELQAHKEIYGNTFGHTPEYSKGYWPAECCFSERNIQILSEEGFEWSVIANSHLSRTLADYPLHYGTNGCNISPPNKADVLSTNGNNWWNGQIDGRGGEFSVPYCYQVHKAKYVNPQTGTEYYIDVVPMCDLLSYRDGYSQQGTGDIDTYIVPYNDPNHKSIVLFAHDGDNAWGGGSSYYFEAVPSFVAAAHNSPNLHPTTIQQFLYDNPVPANDIVHVEDGGWVNAANDWGHPQFINWLWPIYNSSTYEFNPNGWTEDFRNWAVVIAADNYACMAEDLAGGTDINDIVYPTSSSSNAEKAWHFYLPASASCYMYYGTAEDMEVKQTIAGNNAINFAQLEIANHPGVDNTPPSVFIPQRFPYNPGGKEFGPIYGYQEHISSKDFHVWTLAYDVSGIQNAVLKYRVDFNGENPLTSNENETYAGGSGVSAWNSLSMTIRSIDPTYNAGNPQIDFFVLPEAIADLYYAEISGLSDTLVDYYVEVTDTQGNTFKTAIQHVYVGNEEGGGGGNELVSWEPENPNLNDYITVYSVEADENSKLHWGVTVEGINWTQPIEDYWPEGSILFNGTGPAVQSPFSDPDLDGLYTCVIGPFNNASQIIDQIDFVIYIGAGSWNNNNGQDYHIQIENNPNENPVGSNQVVSTMINQMYTFSSDDFYFQGIGGATFAGIQIVSIETNGDLEYNGSDVIAGTDYSDATLLTFLPFDGQTGSPYATFTFKVKDSENRYSDNIYMMSINVFSYNPIGGNSSISILMNQSFNFSNSNFPFIGMNGAEFAGIQLTEIESDGDLEYNGTDVAIGIDYSDLSLLIFIPDTDESGSPYATFQFKVKDSEGRYSDNSYTMTINVVEDIPDGVSWFPESPNENDMITVFVNNDNVMNAFGGKLHWGINKATGLWTVPNSVYWPEGTVEFGDGHSVETPFIEESSTLYSLELGPFNQEIQNVSSLHFVIHYNNNTWNNNGEADWNIDILPAVDVNTELSADIKINPNPIKDFAKIEINYNGNAQFIIQITDIQGNILKSDFIGKSKQVIFYNHLNPGMYIMKFIDQISGNIIAKKIVTL